MANSEIEQLSIDTIRTLSMDGVQKANAGHPARRWDWRRSPISFGVLRHNPADPHWPNRDRFILSAGPRLLLLYWRCTSPATT